MPCCARADLLAITADHGNAEEEIDARGEPVTAHTTNPVPFVLVANDLHGELATERQIRRRGADAADADGPEGTCIHDRR